MDFWTRLQNSFLQVADYVPALLGALVILFAGYLLAKLIERGADRLLARMGLNRWLERGGVLDAVERTGWRRGSWARSCRGTWGCRWACSPRTRWACRRWPASSRSS
jgi:hypothetical protein